MIGPDLIANQILDHFKRGGILYVTIILLVAFGTYMWMAL